MGNLANWQLKASFLSYLVLLVITVAFSVAYLSRTEFMPYHAAVIGQSWSELDAGLQSLILGLMKAVGAAWVSLSVAVAILLAVPFRQGKRWAYWAIPLVVLPALLANLYVVFNMAQSAPASAPWAVVVTNAVLLVIGFALSMVGDAGEA